MSDGEVWRINVSAGGVPKRSIEVGAVTQGGLAGDRQAQAGIHGGPYRALSLFPLELIQALEREEHPIAPGTVGENITTRGLDWSQVRSGARLRLGRDVLIEITSYAAPCSTISGSFSDGNMNRINQRVAPGWSRVYAQVLEEGEVRPGDAIELSAPGTAARGTLAAEHAVSGIGQISVPVDDLERSIRFYRDRLGAKLLRVVDPPGLAHFDLAGVRLMLDGPSHSGGARPAEATTIFFRIDDITRSYEAMRAAGVVFDVAPVLQYKTDVVEGWMAFFSDPDGNRLALLSEVASS